MYVIVCSASADGHCSNGAGIAAGADTAATGAGRAEAHQDQAKPAETCTHTSA